MHVLVTGGCGFIGPRYVALARAAGHTVRVLDNFSTGSREALAEALNTPLEALDQQVEVMTGDIRDAEAVATATQGVDAIVHLAANAGVPQSVDHPRLDFEVNAGGTLNMLEAAREQGIRRFVFASSGAPVGEVEPPVHEEMAAHPKSPYGASKLAGEGYCSAYFHCYGINTVALRFSNVYGPGSWRKGSVVAKFIRSALAGDQVEVYGDGEQTRDFLFVDDLIHAIDAALTIERGGEVVQIATGIEVSVNTLVAELQRMLPELAIRHGGERTGDVRRNYADPAKAATTLGWQASTELRDGLEQTVHWFLARQ